MGYRNYAPANGFLVAKNGTGDFTTITAALTGATPGQTIYINDGTYTENPVLKAGVNLVAWSPDALTPNVTISGKCTFSSAGTVSISGINLQTNSDFALAVTGSAASIVNVINCFVNGLNNTPIDFTSSSAASSINFTNCSGNLATTGIGFFTDSAAGPLSFFNCQISNSGASTTASTTSSGAVLIQNCSFASPLTTSSTGNFAIVNSNFNCGAINTTPLTLAGTGTSQVEYSDFLGGTAPAASIGSGTTLTVSGPCRFDSSNTNAITGAGTIKYTLITYTGTSSTNNVTTQTPLVTQPVISSTSGAWVLLDQATASSSAGIAFSSTYITAAYSAYKILIAGAIPASNGVNLELQFSTNNGSSYLSTGYLATYNFTSSGGSSSSSVTSYVPLSDSSNSIANTANDGWSGEILLQNLTTGGTPVITGNGSYISGSQFFSGTFGGRGPTSITVNNINFLFSSGNIASGTFSLYGISS